jgi:methionyl-tRNA synthetase
MSVLRRYQEQLIEYIKSHPDFIKPDARRNDILSRLQREPLLDLSISRTTFDWGIPVPDDPKHVMCAPAAQRGIACAAVDADIERACGRYVWFDALTNYLTGCDFPDGDRNGFWPASVHIIGVRLPRMRFATSAA